MNDTDDEAYPPPSEMAAYFECVGRIAIGFSFFEMQLNRSIWYLSNVEQHVGACITAQFIGPGPRFRALMALLTLRGASKATLKIFDKLRNDADAISRERNRFVHDPAVMDGNQNFVRFEVTADRKLAFGMETVVLADFQKLEAKIKAITKRFDHAFESALIEIPAFPNVQFGQSAGFSFRPVGT